jgi:hypothetical protein
MAFDWERGISGGLLPGFFGGEDPSEDANKYIAQIPGRTQQYFDPYIKAGTAALPQLQGQYNELMSDPGGMVNKIGAGYHESPGFQFALKKALAGGNRAFAAGGMAGSPSNAAWGMETAEGLANQDYQNYLKNALGQYGLGLGGEEKMAGWGQQSGSDFANMIAQTLAQQAAYKYQGGAAQNQNMNNLLSSGISLAGMFLP